MRFSSAQSRSEADEPCVGVGVGRTCLTTHLGRDSVAGTENNEYFIVQFAMVCVYAWVVILLFLSVKETNNYSVKETVMALLMTAFTLLIAALIIFIVYVLCSQAVDFVTTLAREVVNRFE